MHRGGAPAPGGLAQLLEEFQAGFKTRPTGCAILAPHAAAESAPRAALLASLPFPEEIPMPKFVIERDIPGAGKMSPADLKMISQKSCGVLSSMGPSVQWVHSYVTPDKIYCIYQAADESLVRRHAELGGFPANKISRVSSMIDPATAE